MNNRLNNQEHDGAARAAPPRSGERGTERHYFRSLCTLYRLYTLYTYAKPLDLSTCATTLSLDLNLRSHVCLSGSVHGVPACISRATTTCAVLYVLVRAYGSPSESCRVTAKIQREKPCNPGLLKRRDTSRRVGMLRRARHSLRLRHSVGRV